jgi:transcription antitermination factor NusG
MRPARYNGVVRKQDFAKRRLAMNEEQSFKPGEMVEIVNGPFSFINGPSSKAYGKVREVNNDKQMLVVIVKEGRVGIILGEIPVELRFREVKKIAS